MIFSLWTIPFWYIVLASRSSRRTIIVILSPPRRIYSSRKSSFPNWRSFTAHAKDAPSSPCPRGLNCQRVVSTLAPSNATKCAVTPNHVSHDSRKTHTHTYIYASKLWHLCFFFFLIVLRWGSDLRLSKISTWIKWGSLSMAVLWFYRWVNWIFWNWWEFGREREMIRLRTWLIVDLKGLRNEILCEDNRDVDYHFYFVKSEYER